MREHWSARYLGRPWIAGVWECTDLVRAAVLHLGGPALVIPRPARSAASRDAQICAARRLWRASTAPREGDVALMRAVRTRAWHVGVGVRQPEGLDVLHVSGEWGTLISSQAQLVRWGVCLDGWYTWE